jgi:GH35 family endo-1,4-beta-xylanase
MHWRWIVIVGCLTAALAAANAHASALPAGRAVLAPGALNEQSLAGSESRLCQVKLVHPTDLLLTEALRVTTAPGVTTEWNAQLHADTVSAIDRDDVLIGHFWMRCVESMTGDGAVGFVVEQNSPPFEKLVVRRVSVGGKWTECFVPFAADRAMPAGQAQVCLRLGFDRQIIEIAGVEVLNFGRSVKLQDLPRTRITYPGREPDAAWRRQALDRIEKIRKADLSISVVDSSGKPVEGVVVEANLKRHEFGFGSCVTADMLTGDSPDAEHYRKFVAEHFNRAVFENDLKWPAVYDGIPPTVDQALAWLRAHKIDVRGHNLVWPSWQWLPRQLDAHKTDPAWLAKVTNAHITDVVSHFRGKLFQWDVINEPFSNHDLTDLLGGRDVMVDWFKRAHDADGACQLFLNDYGILEGSQSNAHREHFFQTIQFLKERGAPIHGIGIQSHFASDLPAPAQILSVLDQFAKLNLPIESTELSLSLDEPQLQTDYMRDYLIAVFSHPQVHGIMLWGFWEKRHWRPTAALFAADWSTRPLGQAWLDLVDRDWRTKSRTQTDADGKSTVRGFLGDYEVTISTSDQRSTATVHLPRDGARMSFVLK